MLTIDFCGVFDKIFFGTHAFELLKIKGKNREENFIMKNVKKLLALMLALALVFALTACGSEPKGNVTPSDNTTPSAAPADDKTESTPEPTVEPAPEDDVELGSMTGGVYKNDFVGISCTMDDNWTYYSEEEILALNGLVADSTDDEELAEQLRDSDSFYDMMAENGETLENVNIVLENLGLIYGNTMDASGYIDVALENLESQMKSMGMNVTSCEKVSFDFCGKETDGIYITSSMAVEGMEIEVFQRMACVKAGTYMCVITACSYFEDTTMDVLNLFSAA